MALTAQDRHPSRYVNVPSERVTTDFLHRYHLVIGFCVGAGFAMAEMAMHLTMVAERFRLVPVDAEPAEAEFQINLRTRHPLRMRLVSRR